MALANGAQMATESAEHDWWSKWRDQDYTWEGLAKKGWSGWLVNSDGIVVDPLTGKRYGQPAADLSIATVSNGVEATLQDYWRADPSTGRLRTDEEMGDELVRAYGQVVFHRVHLPFNYGDGTPTGKLNWSDDALAVLVEPRLMAARSTEFEPNFELDDRAQFEGGVWLDAPPYLVRVASYERAAFLRFSPRRFRATAFFSDAIFLSEANFREAEFPDFADFSGTTFLEGARFTDAQFRGRSHFDSSIFLHYADFGGASFEDLASFEQASFADSAWFNDAKFLGVAQFENSSFGVWTSFVAARFRDVAVFRSVRFSGTGKFRRCVFEQETDFEGASFGEIEFVRAVFNGRTVFDGGIAERGVSFSGAVFGVSSSFSCQGRQFRSDADFSDVRFRSLVTFSASRFEGIAIFQRIEWPYRAAFASAFDKTLFQSLADFSSSGCGAFSAFNGASFEGGVRIDVEERSAVRQTYMKELRDACALSGLTPLTTNVSALRPPMPSGPFNPELLREIEDLSLSSRAQRWLRRELITYVGDLVGRTEPELLRSPFARRQLLNEVKQVLASFGLHLGMALESWPPKDLAALSAARYEDDLLAETGMTLPAPSSLVPPREGALLSLESGCRVLKKAMASALDKQREQDFYRFELMARRKQSRTSLTEKAFSYAYGSTARYGDSIGLPFLWLGVLIPAFALLYWWLDANAIPLGSLSIQIAAPLDPEFVRALEFSLSRVFPLGAFEDVSKGWFDAYHRGWHAVPLLAVRVLATLESVLAVALAFAFGLSIRRKFQIM